MPSPEKPPLPLLSKTFRRRHDGECRAGCEGKGKKVSRLAVNERDDSALIGAEAIRCVITRKSHDPYTCGCENSDDVRY